MLCHLCKRDLPESDFSPGLLKHPAPSRHICRACNRERMNEYFARNPEKRKAYNHRYAVNNPDRYSAKNAVLQALQSGRITKTPCAVCGEKDDVDGHHFSYEPKDWLSVIWLCPLHNRQAHDGTLDISQLPVNHGEFPKNYRRKLWEERWDGDLNNRERTDPTD